MKNLWIVIVLCLALAGCGESIDARFEKIAYDYIQARAKEGLITVTNFHYKEGEYYKVYASVATLDREPWEYDNLDAGFFYIRENGEIAKVTLTKTWWEVGNED